MKVWNANMGISYVDYKLAALQAAGYRIRVGTENGQYIATNSEQRVVLTFNKNDRLIKVSGSTNRRMGMATYTTAWDDEALDRFMRYFKAI